MTWSKEAQQMIEEVADTSIGSFESDLDNVVRTYCTDIDLVEKGVNGFLNDLPQHKALHIDGFIAWKMLHRSASILAKYAKEALLLREGKDPISSESLTPEDKTPTVDDKAIRDSAGFHNDQEVADSSLTDKAQQFEITDNDIGKSSRDDNFVYEDQIFNVPDPATVYRHATKYLFSTIIKQCLGQPPPKRLEALIQNQVISHDQVTHLVSEMRAKLDKGLRIPRSDDQMS